MMWLLFACASQDSAAPVIRPPTGDSQGDDVDGDGYTTADGDCDDADPAVHPGAEEVCDGLDNDCDGEADASIPTWHADEDGDGFGDPLTVVAACTAPAGWVGDATDCDDADATSFPGAEDPCYDGVDHDCDGAEGADCRDCTWVVPDDVPTIQGAIDASAEGATICVQPGTWMESLVIDTPGLSLVGLGGSGETTLDVAGMGPGVYVMTADGLVIEGFTIQNGNGGFGGGISLYSTVASFRDLIVQRNVATDGGGGIALMDADVTMELIELLDNVVSSLHGGGLYADQSTLRIRGLHAEGNYARYGGGGLALDDCDGVLDDITLIGNTAVTDGGGLQARGGTLSLRWVVADGNNADHGRAGGLYLSGVRGRLRDSRVSGNSAVDGGGAYVTGDGFDFQRVEFSGNQGTQSGSALVLDGANSALIDVTMDGNGTNSASTLYALASSFFAVRLAVRDNSGGGIVAERGSPMITNSEVSGNTFVGVSLTDVASVHLDHTRIAGNVVGIALSGGAVVVDHVALVGNEGGALVVHEGTASVDHASIVGTIAENGAVAVGAGTTLTVQRTIISGTDGGAGVVAEGAEVSVATALLWDNEGGDYLGLDDQTGTNGNLVGDPAFLDLSGVDPVGWDLHVAAASPGIDVGDDLDPDGSPGQVGIYGGMDGATWDLDGDGFVDWWLPGPYDPVSSPTADCDDRDASRYPGVGC